LATPSKSESKADFSEAEATLAYAKPPDLRATVSICASSYNDKEFG